jgi:hypothetical protein
MQVGNKLAMGNLFRVSMEAQVEFVTDKLEPDKHAVGLSETHSEPVLLPQYPAVNRIRTCFGFSSSSAITTARSSTDNTLFPSASKTGLSNPSR